MSNHITTNEPLSVTRGGAVSTCILMHTNRRLADLGHSCENEAVALWVRPGKSPIPVCAAHAATAKTTKEITK